MLLMILLRTEMLFLALWRNHHIKKATAPSRKQRFANSDKSQRRLRNRQLKQTSLIERFRIYSVATYFNRSQSIIYLSYIVPRAKRQ